VGKKEKIPAKQERYTRSIEIGKFRDGFFSGRKKTSPGKAMRPPSIYRLSKRVQVSCQSDNKQTKIQRGTLMGGWKKQTKRSQKHGFKKEGGEGGAVPEGTLVIKGGADVPTSG